MSTTPTDGGSGSVRRQARGLRRADEVLATAAVVFAETGFERATTNLIAKRAGISPGSLYQYFRDKEAIARGLAERYVERLAVMQSEAFELTGDAEQDFDAVVDHSIDRIVGFNVDNPGFLALLMRADEPKGLREAVAPLQEELFRRVHGLLASFADRNPDADVAVATVMAMQISRGVMPVIAAADDPRRSPLVPELKRALKAYLTAALR
ncbi:TetR/AcrR family transcriptional regulator [Nocardia sp. NBC_00416]|uniref:TetR/AcrR family transcriptional regulator n=1 Tax=Nocardia sp. NBC_00416 TaxID=2975991 RepID=UPI002E1C4308